MALIRWSPNADLTNIHTEMDRVFDELARGMGFSPRLNGSAHAFLPIDVKVEGDSIVVEASVPGFKPEEVTVTVQDGLLTIEARHGEETKQEEKSFLRQERYDGYLYRQVALGSEVDSDKAKGTFENGVLRLTIPAVQKAQPKRIPIAAGTK